MEVPTVSVKDMLPFQRPREKFLALGPSHMAIGGIASYFIAYWGERSVCHIASE